MNCGARPWLWKLLAVTCLAAGGCWLIQRYEVVGVIFYMATLPIAHAIIEWESR